MHPILIFKIIMLRRRNFVQTNSLQYTDFIIIIFEAAECVIEQPAKNVGYGKLMHTYV